MSVLQGLIRGLAAGVLARRQLEQWQEQKRHQQALEELEKRRLDIEQQRVTGSLQQGWEQLAIERQRAADEEAYHRDQANIARARLDWDKERYHLEGEREAQRRRQGLELLMQTVAAAAGAGVPRNALPQAPPEPQVKPSPLASALPPAAAAPPASSPPPTQAPLPTPALAPEAASRVLQTFAEATATPPAVPPVAAAPTVPAVTAPPTTRSIGLPAQPIPKAALPIDATTFNKETLARLAPAAQPLTAAEAIAQAVKMNWNVQIGPDGSISVRPLTPSEAAEQAARLEAVRASTEATQAQREATMASAEATRAATRQSEEAHPVRLQLLQTQLDQAKAQLDEFMKTQPLRLEERRLGVQYAAARLESLLQTMERQRLLFPYEAEAIRLNLQRARQTLSLGQLSEAEARLRLALLTSQYRSQSSSQSSSGGSARIPYTPDTSLAYRDRMQKEVEALNSPEAVVAKNTDPRAWWGQLASKAGYWGRYLAEFTDPASRDKWRKDYLQVFGPLLNEARTLGGGALAPSVEAFIRSNPLLSEPGPAAPSASPRQPTKAAPVAKQPAARPPATRRWRGSPPLR